MRLLSLSALMKHLLAFSFVFTFFCRSFAADDPSLGYLGIEHGLSNNAVTTIYQDSYGFMWFGTYDGLNRFDGYNFKVFHNRLKDSTSLTNNWIVAISEDSKHNILVGTKQGANLYDPITGKFSFITFRSNLGIPVQNAVKAINGFETDGKQLGRVAA